MIQPIWSATSCHFPGAGVYIGLAPWQEHLLVSRLLSPKRLRHITGGTTRFGAGLAVGPLEYFAVRDPSVVRVIPVKRPPLPNGGRHVKLSYQLAGLPGEEVASGIRRSGSAGLDWSAAFLLTIGLPLADEDEFYRRAVVADPRQNFSDLYARVREIGADRA